MGSTEALKLIMEELSPGGLLGEQGSGWARRQPAVLMLRAGAALACPVAAPSLRGAAPASHTAGLRRRGLLKGSKWGWHILWLPGK